MNLLTMASLLGRVSKHILAQYYHIEKGEYTSYKTVILFIFMLIDDFVTILFILTPSG